MTAGQLLRILLVGPGHDLQPAESAIRVQRRMLCEAKASGTFGLERLAQFFFLLASFAFPALYIREVSGRWGYVVRKIAVKLYVIFKVGLPLTVLWLDCASSPWVICLVIGDN
jgi:hypothetical protein